METFSERKITSSRQLSIYSHRAWGPFAICITYPEERMPLEQELHIVHSRRLGIRFYAAALRERTRMKFFNKSAALSPMVSPRARVKKNDEPPAVRTNISEDNTTELGGNDNAIAINLSPSFGTVQACYEHFVARQRKHESSRYIRTLSGTFTLF
ncbi:hypothetical protein L804_03232 [Cryptococcus deuterogattii 2001/935-1]|nr:hypothetical protein L804_03232 [Cryptococcus deuterogattii 2001/935-1]